MLKSILSDFDADLLLEKAIQGTGLDDYGDRAFERPFRLLIKALNQEACLSVKGQIMARADLLKLLQNRLFLVRDRQFLPNIAKQTIKKPIFILGFPRTGSSFLHNLLAQDSRLQIPRYWETLYPSPPPDAVPDIQRIVKTNWDFRWFNWLNPKYKWIYQYGSQKAAECIALMASSFASSRFAFTYQVPSYWQWVQANSLRSGYQYHKEFLQHLQVNRPQGRWVLKAPAHLLHLKTLLEVYPDAVVIFTHRHPLNTIASIASNTFTLRQTFCRTVEPHAVGREELARWQIGWERSQALRHNWTDYWQPYLDVKYEALRQHPMTVVEAIYQHCQMTLDATIRMKMQRFITTVSRGQHHKHRYSLEQFGLSQANIHQEFAEYLECFGF